MAETLSVIDLEYAGLVVTISLIGGWAILAWLAPRQWQQFQIRTLARFPKWWPLRDFQLAFYGTAVHIWLQRVFATFALLCGLSAVIILSSRPPVKVEAITVTAPEHANDFRIGSFVVLSVGNNSKDVYWFATDYGLSVSYWEEASATWRTLDQDFDFPVQPGKDTLLYPASGQGFLDTLVIPISPILPNPQVETRVRIEVRGYLYINGAPTGNSAVATTEILLKP